MIVNIYMITNRINGHKYLGFSEKQLNKVWADTLQKYTNENSALYNTMRRVGDKHFKISIVEEVNKNRLEERMEYWMGRYAPEYNNDVIPHTSRKVDNKASYKRGKRKWGIQRSKKPKGSPRHNVIKCRNIETGKLKTLHGWQACLVFCGGKDLKNIKRAVKTGGSDYGYKWWIYEKNSDIRRKVYGVADGDVTKIFDSITSASEAFGCDDRGKGICTSIKWKTKWKGYNWHYADVK